MSVQEIDVTDTASAFPAAVWRLLGDSATWPSWTSIDSYERLAPGSPDGVGEVRVFRTGRRYVIREQVVERRPQQRLSYVLLGGLPLRDYRADIDLSPEAGGRTRIRWHTTFAPKVPGTGWLYRRALQRATRSFVDGLVRASAAAGSAEPPVGDTE